MVVRGYWILALTEISISMDSQSDNLIRVIQFRDSIPGIVTQRVVTKINNSLSLYFQILPGLSLSDNKNEKCNSMK